MTNKERWNHYLSDNFVNQGAYFKAFERIAW